MNQSEELEKAYAFAFVVDIQPSADGTYYLISLIDRLVAALPPDRQQLQIGQAVFSTRGLLATYNNRVVYYWQSQLSLARQLAAEVDLDH